MLKHIDVPQNCLEQFYMPDVSMSFQLFAVHCSRVNSSWNFAKHKHLQMFELFQVLEGAMRVTVNHSQYILYPGDLVLINPNDSHSNKTIGSSGTRYLCMHFTVDDPAFIECIYQFNTVYYEHKSALFDDIGRPLSALVEIATEGKARHNHLLISSHSFAIFAGFYTFLSNNKTASTPAFSMDLANHIAKELKRIVKEPGDIYTNEFKREWINEVSRQYGLSSKQCNRIFHRKFGMSPRQYLSQLRLEEAKRLLKESDYTVQEISAFLGYQETGSFSRQFKRWTGMTPRKYRATQCHYLLSNQSSNG